MCVEEVPGGGPEGAALVHVVEPMREVDCVAVYLVCGSCRRTRVMRTGEQCTKAEEGGTFCPSCKSTLCIACGVTLFRANKAPGTRGAGLIASTACGAQGPADVVLLHIANHMHGTTALPVVCSKCGTMALPTWGEPVVCPRHPDARVCGPCADLLVRLFALWLGTAPLWRSARTPTPVEHMVGALHELDLTLKARGLKVDAKVLGIDREALGIKASAGGSEWSLRAPMKEALVAPSAAPSPAPSACACEWSATCFGTGRRQCWGGGVVGDPLRQTAKCRCACGGFRTCHGCPDCARPADRGGP